ncbi:MAG: peptidase C39 [Faecalibacterium sp.]|nr:peptidase C39 [Ruminococcus sp.]MCM1392198.1 peptidase C39 [Ruminococcus sp.]MCM1485392.1 peptidase C39 [Faecalibacterium sp.]
MKIPLHYQITEYDCAPTSIFNALSVLFEREEIPPEIIKMIMAFSLDRHGKDGMPGKGGTSCRAMKDLTDQLNKYSKESTFPLKCTYLEKDDVFLESESKINVAVKSGSVAVLRLYFDVWHYVLLTEINETSAYIFDPYYKDKSFQQTDIILDDKHIFKYNRIVPLEYFSSESIEIYALGEMTKREAVIFSRTNEEVKHA